MLSFSKYFITVLSLRALFTTQPLFADTYTPRFDARQGHQQRRIDHGTASGKLVPGEMRRLEVQQNRIQHAENRAKSDGIVTREERIRLQHWQNKANRNIDRKKHNRFNW